MLQFDEYKVKLNNLRPELDELDQALGLETAIREVEMLDRRALPTAFGTTWRRPKRCSSGSSNYGTRLRASKSARPSGTNLMTCVSWATRPRTRLWFPK